MPLANMNLSEAIKHVRYKLFAFDQKLIFICTISFSFFEIQIWYSCFFYSKKEEEEAAISDYVLVSSYVNICIKTLCPLNRENLRETK